MPGYYDEWIGEERQRLAALHDRLQQEARPGAAAAMARRPSRHAGPPSPACLAAHPCPPT
jgi:hypothetical protein